MRQVRLVGLAEDGASLVLESPTGESFRLPLDDRVRAAARGDVARMGQIELETDAPLRPRDIQVRVRAGESAEQVAASAGMAVERVLRFAYPVLQERARVVSQARGTQVRPQAPEALGELVEERLVGRGADPGALEWDAWRRDDGKWVVQLSWRHGTDRPHSATWTLDLARRALLPQDAAAEQLSAAEFHARTITAVTPLAAAARAADAARTAEAATRASSLPRRQDPRAGVRADEPAPEVEVPRPSITDARRRTSIPEIRDPRTPESRGPRTPESRGPRAPETRGPRAPETRDPRTSDARDLRTPEARDPRASESRGPRSTETRVEAPDAGSHAPDATAEVRAEAPRAEVPAAGRIDPAAVPEAPATEATPTEATPTDAPAAEATAVEAPAAESPAAEAPVEAPGAAGGGPGPARGGAPAGGNGGNGGNGGARVTSVADRRGRRRRMSVAEEAPAGPDLPTAHDPLHAEPKGVEPDEERDEEPRRVAAAGGMLPGLDALGPPSRDETDEERARRATVPSWDDILLGVRRRH